MIAFERAAWACFTAAAALPFAMGWGFNALTSPYERALRDAFCGAPYHAGEFLGHCAACWSGSTLLIAAGLALLHIAARRPRALSASRR